MQIYRVGILLSNKISYFFIVEYSCHLTTTTYPITEVPQTPLIL